MMHIGPWSNIKKAATVFSKKDIALDICLNSVGDIYDRSEIEMRQKLEMIKSECEGKVRYSVRADGLAVLNSIEFTLDKIDLWKKVAWDVFPG
jgi:hypothetical protein